MGSANLRRGCLSWTSGPRVIQPSIIKDIGRVIELLRARGNMAILLVEQYFEFAGFAQNIAVMERAASLWPAPAVKSTRKMFDAGFPSDPASLQRAEGSLGVSFRARCGTTVLDTLHQAGCLKARFPRQAAREWAEVVTVNSSGGIAAGDRLSSRFSVACGASVTITTQAAERFYRARAGENSAVVENRVEIEPGATAEWLPQETIFFNGAAVSRGLHVELAAGAEFLGVEMLVFGRALMGETVRQLKLRDRLRITRDGRPLLHDVVRIDGDAAALLSRPGTAAGMRAVATFLCVAADAGVRLKALREALQDTEAGASVDGDLLVARILAPSGADLRRAVETGLFALRRRSLPRIWLL